MAEFKRSVDVTVTVLVRGQLTELGDARDLQVVAAAAAEGARHEVLGWAEQLSPDEHCGFTSHIQLSSLKPRPNARRKSER